MLGQRGYGPEMYSQLQQASQEGLFLVEADQTGKDNSFLSVRILRKMERRVKKMHDALAALIGRRIRRRIESPQSFLRSLESFMN
jgi:hypothetical protein